jgi:ATP-dependent RNA helicase RhlE
MSFKNFGFLKQILQAVEEKGYREPTAIQTEAIPSILKGHDLLAGAQTGTGKTASFTLPLLQRLMSGLKIGHKTRALILTPTRELAAQVAESVHTYGKYLEFKAVAIFGGVTIKSQVKLLKEGADILIATPGRLLDLVSQKIIDLSQVEIFVLDEADRMMDMGFIHDIKKVIALLPKHRQNLLFSATFSPEIKKLGLSLLKSPQVIEVAVNHTPAERIVQLVYPVDNKRKSELLSFLISSKKWSQVLVFVRTKHGANKLTKHLIASGITAEAIHGNKSQSARLSALANFKKGSVRVLVATDIASRGLDIDYLPHVVNFELPNVVQDYIHRIGRTGRAGREGCAYSLVCIDEHQLLFDIEKLLKTKLPQIIEPGYEPNPTIQAQPIPNGQRHSQLPRSHHHKPKNGSFKNRARSK